jgi:hypothetical protein
MTAPLSGHALENRYDVLARTLAPIAALFVENAETRTVRTDFTLLELTGAPKEVLGSAFTLAIQPPDRIAVTAEILGERVTICRNRQRVWAAPGSKFRAILAQFEPLPAPDPKFTLGRLRLPFPPEQLALLPALFVATDGGEETVDDQPCRVLDLALMPELAQSAGAENWSVRLWITADHKPARLLLQRPDGRLLVAFQKVEYGVEFPESQWMPGPTETDAIGLDAARLSQLMQLIARELGGRLHPLREFQILPPE